MNVNFFTVTVLIYFGSSYTKSAPVLIGGNFTACNNVVINQNVTINNGEQTITNTSFMSPVSHKIIDLGTSSARIQWVTNINERGQVVGMCILNAKNHLFKWDEATGYTFELDSRRAMYCSAGYPPHLNKLGTLSLLPINDKGDTYHVDENNKLRKNNMVIEDALKWDNRECYKLSVNNSGQVLGLIETAPGRRELIIWNETSKNVTYINQGSKFNIHPSDINDRGWVIGWFMDEDGKQHGIFWTPELGSKILPFKPSAINNHGVIVGSKRDLGIGDKAVLWFNGQIVDVNAAMNITNNPSTTVLKIIELSGINDNGQMIGWGKGNYPHEQRAIFISPIKLH